MLSYNALSECSAPGSATNSPAVSPATAAPAWFALAGGAALTGEVTGASLGASAYSAISDVPRVVPLVVVVVVVVVVRERLALVSLLCWKRRVFAAGSCRAESGRSACRRVEINHCDAMGTEHDEGCSWAGVPATTTPAMPHLVRIRAGHYSQLQSYIIQARTSVDTVPLELLQLMIDLRQCFFRRVRAEPRSDQG